MDDFNESIFQTVEWIGNIVYQSCEELFLDLENSIAEIDSAVETFLDPWVSWLDEASESVFATSRPFIQTVAPPLQEHPACTGCANYHGESYGGNVLVCAMHPYGADDLKCPDWESAWGAAD